MVKNLPSQVGDIGSFPGWETKIPVPMCYKATVATVLQLESPCTALLSPCAAMKTKHSPPKKKESKPLVSSGECHIPRLRKKGAKKKWRPQHRPPGWRRQKDNHRCRQHQGCPKAKGKVKQRCEST